ncbi:phosphoadenosine phosphosulfate reductase [Endozoicomonas sp. OPT23]|uniref:phosphoadenosine phosphosulfate reductase n=1 Tax=Endozoicomonas sp. OPT23 TaxID=2072845 RepID=UPI00129B708C|nr:phosphoadenosine phosphosulfate reductase [Endozoicomonas sp. OPT23]MRI34079.1 phosphoadenosine phosphosulfate reductase [Endozoicomonas sp. OPT23]
MNEILELQSGQVAYISSLMAGFSLSIAVQIIRSKNLQGIATVSYILFTLTALLFLIALYVDVSLNLRLIGIENFADETLKQIATIRSISTSIATSAFFLFILSIGLVGWLRSKRAGIFSTILVLLSLVTIATVRSVISGLPV